MRKRCTAGAGEGRRGHRRPRPVRPGDELGEVVDHDRRRPVGEQGLAGRHRGRRRPPRRRRRRGRRRRRRWRPPPPSLAPDRPRVDRPRAGTCRVPACREVLRRRARCRRPRPPNRSVSPAAASTSGVFRDDDTTATAVPRRSRASSSARRAGIGGDAVGAQDLPERLVLGVAEGADAVVTGRVVGGAVGQIDPAGAHERPHAVEPGPAVDVAQVVVGREPALVRRPGGQEVVERRRPRPFVDQRGRRQHPVEVEQHAVEQAPVDGPGGVSHARPPVPARRADRWRRSGRSPATPTPAPIVASAMRR